MESKKRFRADATVPEKILMARAARTAKIQPGSADGWHDGCEPGKPCEPRLTLCDSRQPQAVGDYDAQRVFLTGRQGLALAMRNAAPRSITSDWRGLAYRPGFAKWAESRGRGSMARDALRGAV